MVQVTTEHPEGDEQKAEVDEAIARFDAWFQQQGNNDPLVRGEHAIISTFLWWATHVSKDALPGG